MKSFLATLETDGRMRKLVTAVYFQVTAAPRTNDVISGALLQSRSL